MNRRPILVSMALAALLGIACSVPTKTLLTVRGSIGRINNKTSAYGFSEVEFLKLTTVVHCRTGSSESAEKLAEGSPNGRAA